MDLLKKYTVDKESIKKSSVKVLGNTRIAEFYNKLSKEYDSEVLDRRAFSVNNCFKMFDLDYFEHAGVKDIKRVNLCHDKFCRNCQNLLAKRRYMKFYPMISRLTNKYKAYHVILTVSNVPGDLLNLTLNKMYVAVPQLIRFFNGTRKIKGIDFKKYGFTGAVRSLEITTKLNANGEVEYHPHFHCLFLLKKGLDEPHTIYNKFSFDKYHKKENYAFSEMEILIQKLFYLIYNGKRINKKAIEELPLGYSCRAEKIKTAKVCSEVFKYTLKESFDDLCQREDIFQTLYWALYRRRIIQGYGCLYDVDFDGGITEDEIEEFYMKVITSLWKKGAPRRQYLTISDIVSKIDDDGIIYISRNSLRSGLFEDKEESK